METPKETLKLLLDELRAEIAEKVDKSLRKSYLKGLDSAEACLDIKSCQGAIRSMIKTIKILIKKQI